MFKRRDVETGGGAGGAGMPGGGGAGGAGIFAALNC